MASPLTVQPATEIASIRSEKEMRARIYGDFVHFRGRVLEEFDHDKHVVPTPTRDQVVASLRERRNHARKTRASAP